MSPPEGMEDVLARGWDDPIDWQTIGDERVQQQYNELRAAASWLVDIWADNEAIEVGSALWEDLQRLKAVLTSRARQP